MKKIIIIFIALFIVFFLSCIPNEVENNFLSQYEIIIDEYEIDLDIYHKIINELLSNFDKIMKDNQTSVYAYDAYFVSMEYLKNNEVVFRINPEMNTILSGMQFYIDDDGRIGFIFGTKFLDTYKIDSSIHYSILIHECRHMHDYLTTGDYFLSAVYDEKINYLFEMDALRIEAEFIKYYLYGKFNLSQFEQYILASFEGDNLNSASMMIQREHRDIFMYFYDLEIKYFNGEISRENIIEQLIHNGSIILEDYYHPYPDYVHFFNYIGLTTFNKYMIRSFSFLVDNPETTTWEEIFRKYPEIERIHLSIIEIQNRDRMEHTHYLQEVIDYWESEILDNL
ncbi:MAG: hypothetical protein FWD24_00270 [Treponema sp.]|nr:hypothetical protein [Treponema sp.]